MDGRDGYQPLLLGNEWEESDWTRTKGRDTPQTVSKLMPMVSSSPPAIKTSIGLLHLQPLGLPLKHLALLQTRRLPIIKQFQPQPLSSGILYEAWNHPHDLKCSSPQEKSQHCGGTKPMLLASSSDVEKSFGNLTVDILLSCFPQCFPRVNSKFKGNSKVQSCWDSKGPSERES